MDLVKKAVANRQFPQVLFLSEGWFNSFLRDRGFRVGIAGVRSLVAVGLIQRLDTQSGDFHPFQIWPISKLLGGLEFQLDVGFSRYGSDPAGMKQFIDLNWPRRANDLTSFPNSALCIDFNRKLFPLLLWLESYFLPVIRGPRPGVVHLVGFDTSEWTRWDNSSQSTDLLAEHSISIEQLIGWRDRILFDAFNYDPAPGLYLLLRSMPFEQRNKFKGRLRLAYDLYEIAEVIRLFLEQVSDQPVAKEWDPNGHPDTPWVENIYGSQPKFGAPGFLRPVVRHYGLDPAFRVRWLVEGETEEAFILQYTRRLGANIREFVTIRNFRGDGAFQKHLAAIDSDLEAAREEQCFVTLTFDESKRARSRMEELRKSGLVNFRFVLNAPDFELDNFTVEQLIAVAVSWASHLQRPIKLCRATLAREVESRISKKKEDFRKALNWVLWSNGEPFQLSKGPEWGTRLADHLSERRASEAKAEAHSERTLTKIERQILFALRNSQPLIDYPLSIENLDQSALEIV